MEHLIKDYSWNLLIFSMKLGWTQGAAVIGGYQKASELVYRMWNADTLYDREKEAKAALETLGSVTAALEKVGGLVDDREAFQSAWVQHHLLMGLLEWVASGRRGGLTPGQVVTLGCFPQDGDIPAPIRWRVLSIREDRALLLSEYGLMSSGYAGIWENCGKILSESFSLRERSLLLPKTAPGPDQGSLICLPTEEEIQNYLPSRALRLCTPTPNAIAAGAQAFQEFGSSSASWWLAPKNGMPDIVLYDGKCIVHSRSAAHSDFCLRPCVWVKVSKHWNGEYRLGCEG